MPLEMLPICCIYAYSYATSTSSDNTGNVATQTSTYGANSFVQTYTYDGVNRLATATETGPGPQGWKQTYGYDAVGNRWLDTTNNHSYGIALNSYTPTASSVYTDDSGQISNHNNGANGRALYDGAGNQIQIGGPQGYHYTYDAENRLVSSSMNGMTTYGYDGDGRRIRKTTPNDSTYYVYDGMGNLAAEYTTSTQRMACTTCYLMADHLGSTRMLTDAFRNVISLHDYLPFGEEIPNTTDGRDPTWAHVDPTQRFTGQERDAETGLDNFIARYLSGVQGRFTGADDPLNNQDEADPQTWNLYGYVRNNPLRFIDPSGKCSQDANGAFFDADDAGKFFFTGPCESGPIGEDGKNNANSVTVGIGWEEARLLMFQEIGEKFNSPHQYADLVSNAGQSALNVFAPLATAIVQCFAGQCDTTNVALAMIPIPRVPGTSVGRFVKNGKLRNILAAFNRTGTGIGTGSTADPIRHELQTGAAVGGKFHYTKGVELRDALLKLWRNPNLDPADRAVVKETLTDLQGALSSK